MDFAKIWPLTGHNLVTFWPLTKNNTTNREYSARAICWSFPLSSTTLRLELPGGGVASTPLTGRVMKKGLPVRGLKGLSHLGKSCQIYPNCVSKCYINIFHITRYFWVKSYQRNQCNVLNILTCNAIILHNFFNCGTVPLMNIPYFWWRFFKLRLINTAD